MVFINERYHKKIFRDIEKATKKCVHLNGAIEYVYILFMNNIMSIMRVGFIRYSVYFSIINGKKRERNKNRTSLKRQPCRNRSDTSNLQI